jgi:hypothetical protein
LPDEHLDKRWSVVSRKDLEGLDALEQWLQPLERKVRRDLKLGKLVDASINSLVMLQGQDGAEIKPKSYEDSEFVGGFRLL